jgi:hypothetical protein
MKNILLATSLIISLPALADEQIPHAKDNGRGDLVFDRPICAENVLHNVETGERAHVKDGVLYARSIAVPGLLYNGDCANVDPEQYASFKEVRVGTVYRN